MNTPYQLNGTPIEYEELIEALVSKLEVGIEVQYAYHLGVDLYWTENAPHWSRPVELTSEGLEVEGRLIEELYLDKSSLITPYPFDFEALPFTED